MGMISPMIWEQDLDRAVEMCPFTDRLSVSFGGGPASPELTASPKAWIVPGAAWWTRPKARNITFAAFHAS